MQSRVVPRPGTDYYFVYISTPSSSRAKAIQTREYRGGAAQFSRDLHRAATSIAPPSLIGEGPPPSPSLVSGRRVIPLDLGSPHRRRPSSPGALSLDPRASGLPRARLRPPPPPWPPRTEVLQPCGQVLPAQDPRFLIRYQICLITFAPVDYSF